MDIATFLGPPSRPPKLRCIESLGYSAAGLALLCDHFKGEIDAALSELERFEVALKGRVSGLLTFREIGFSFTPSDGLVIKARACVDERVGAARIRGMTGLPINRCRELIKLVEVTVCMTWDGVAGLFRSQGLAEQIGDDVVRAALVDWMDQYIDLSAPSLAEDLDFTAARNCFDVALCDGVNTRLSQMDSQTLSAVKRRTSGFRSPTEGIPLLADLDQIGPAHVASGLMPRAARLRDQEQAMASQ